MPSELLPKNEDLHLVVFLERFYLWSSRVSHFLLVWLERGCVLTLQRLSVVFARMIYVISRFTLAVSKSGAFRRMSFTELVF